LEKVCGDKTKFRKIRKKTGKKEYRATSEIREEKKK